MNELSVETNREAIKELLAELSLTRCLALVEGIGGSAIAARRAHDAFIASDDFQRLVDKEIEIITAMHQECDSDVLH